MKSLRSSLLAIGLLAIAIFAQDKHLDHPYTGPEEGLGHVHMELSCSAAVAADFDRALALLHNFWYVRALERFNEVSKKDPDCSMAYWGAAMTYNHPFWDPPSQADEKAAWALVQKGLSSPGTSPR